MPSISKTEKEKNEFKIPNNLDLKNHSEKFNYIKGWSFIGDSNI